MDNREILLELSKICKEKRKEKGLTLRDIHNLTYIPVDILEKLENDEKYITTNPYSKFLLKLIAKSLGIDISDLTKLLKEEKIEEKKEKLDLTKGVNTTISTILAMSTIIYAANVNKSNQSPDKFEVYLKLTSLNKDYYDEDRYRYNPTSQSKKLEEKKIEFIAEGKVWFTAYIDGVEKVVKLSPNDRLTLKFFNKIKFETIGNADKLVVSFKGKKIRLSDKDQILHNIFIDEEGIFINGYNLLNKVSNLAKN